MPRLRKGVLERNASADLWKHTLSHIPTIYGRLTYLASLRDANSGLYRHHGLSDAFGRENSSNALKDSHEQVFREWLGLSISEKHEDLIRYIGSLDHPPEVVVNHWLQSRIHESQPPNSAQELERSLFCIDLEALLETLKDAVAQDPASLLRP